MSQEVKFRLVDIQGGTAHNAIPRDAQAFISINDSDFEKVRKTLLEFEKVVQAEFKNTDPELSISISEEKNAPRNKVLTDASSAKTINLILALPHGVAAMSTDIKNLVETSNNFANISIENDVLKILTSQRSSLVSRLKAHTAKIEAVARLCGAQAESGDGYPPWPPNMESPLLKKCAEVYEGMFNKKPVIEIIHAGLECGIIGSKYPRMDMISFGPTIKFPHSPDEKIHVGTIAQVWDFMVEVLKSLK